MEVSDITNSAKSYPIAFLGGVISILLIVYFYMSMNALPQYQQQVIDLERELFVLKSNSRDGIDLELDYEEFSNGFQQVRSRLIDRYQIANNNGFFYNLGQTHPVDIISVTQKAVINESAKPVAGNIWTLKHFAVIPVDIEVVGFLTDILDFMYVLDQCDRFISVERFDMEIASSREPGYMRVLLGVNVLGNPLNQTD